MFKIYIYICIYMAKTIMVSDMVYERLSKLKKSADYSYSAVLSELMDKEMSKSNSEALLALRGKWKESKEDEKLAKGVDKAWKLWGKTFV